MWKSYLFLLITLSLHNLKLASQGDRTYETYSDHRDLVLELTSRFGGGR